MLSSAMGSHPDISSIGIGLEDDVGNCQIVHLPFNSPHASKYIVLRRGLDARLRSMGNTGFKHFTDVENYTLQSATIKDSSIHQELLDHFISDNECLILEYDELTDGKDCRMLPELYGRQICQYLGVNYQPLIPTTFKPMMI